MDRLGGPRPARKVPRRRRSVVWLIAALLGAGVSAVIGASPAQAATCTNWRSQTITGDVSKVTFSFSNNCSDGLSHITGTVYDTKCDSRQAKAVIVVMRVPLIGAAYEMWSKTAQVDGGCGNNSTFIGSGP